MRIIPYNLRIMIEMRFVRNDIIFAMNQALFFDINDTLVNHSSAQEKAIKKLAKHLPHVIELDFYNTWKKISIYYWKLFEQKKISYDEQRFKRVIETWNHFKASLSSQQISEFADDYIKYYEEVLSANPALLKIIKTSRLLNTTIGVISNGYGPMQRRRLKVVGLERYFDNKLVFISDEIGIEKPDERIFILAENAIGLPSLQLVMYGDDYKNDIEPTKKRGWKAIQITPHK